jgi:pyridoxamine 5'-phosphate oxidase family protein
MSSNQSSDVAPLPTFMVVATFKPDTDMGEVMTVVVAERAQVDVLKREGRMGSGHISQPRGTVFLEIFAANEADAALTVETLPMSKWWDLDVYPCPAPVLPAGLTPAPAKLMSAAEGAYLSTQTLGRLATVNRSGIPQNAPVSFTYNKETGTIDIGGYAMGTTRKFANVAATGVASLVIDDIADPVNWAVRGVEIRGNAEALRNVEPPTPYMSREIVRIYPTRIISWGLDDNAEADGA